MKRMVYISQIVQTIFIVILISIALLHNSGVIAENQSLVALYTLTTFGFFLITLIIAIILMVKYKEREKFIGINTLIMVIELILLLFFCIGVDNRVDKINFRKQCGETKATIYRIDRHEKVYEDNDGEEKKEVKYVYNFSYSAMGEYGYGGSYESSIKSHNEGDKITIYYNKENPEDYRLSIGYASIRLLSIIIVIVSGLRIFSFLRIKNYKEI